MQISSRTGRFPVHTAVIDRLVSAKSQTQLYEEWKEQCPSMAVPDPAFPATVAEDGPELYDIPLDHQQSVHAMLELLRLALRYNEESADGGLLFQLVFEDQEIFCFVGHSMYLERGAFQAEMMRMVRTSPGAEFPFFLHYQISVAAGEPWPAIESETSFVCNAVAQSNGQAWNIFQILNDPAWLSCRKAYSRKALDLDNLQSLDLHRLQQAAVMKLFRQSMGLTTKKRHAMQAPQAEVVAEVVAEVQGNPKK